MKTAILLGATGLTGSYLLELLLYSNEYKEVKIFNRRPCNKEHPKLKEYIIDLLDLENYRDVFSADELFCCIGTTRNKTKDKNLYRAIDYGIPLLASKLAEENGIRTISVISAIGSNKNSIFFYSQIKGEMEEAILKSKVPNILIYRPSLIYGKRKDKRLGESISLLFFRLFKLILPKKYRAISGKELAIELFNGINHHQGHQTIDGRKFIYFTP